MYNGIKNKRILITAGPTWIPIDNVRVISNIATGETGILLADRLSALGAKVTLILGPVEILPLKKAVRIIRYKFFDQLKDNLEKEIKINKYDILIHSAAVSDYKPIKVCHYKVKSGISSWKLNLIPTIKIIDLIKKMDGSLFMIGFKFEPNLTKRLLISEAIKLIQRADLDLAVANTVRKNSYQAYIVDKIGQRFGPLCDKKILVERLVSFIIQEARKDKMDLLSEKRSLNA